jgi:DNA-binding response OmpR family regulator
MRSRVLIVEDDAATAAFLLGTLDAFADVRWARTLVEAGQALADDRFDVWLVDLGLPDGDGQTWMQEQRRAGRDAPVLAMSADLEPGRVAELRALGFADALRKPCDWATLHRHLKAVVPALADRWNDAAGLAAAGRSPALLERLRGLFLGELNTQCAAVLASLDANQTDAARQVLHRMRSGCGMVGAEALGAAVANLYRQPADARYREAFVAEVTALRLSPSASAPAREAEPAR